MSDLVETCVHEKILVYSKARRVTSSRSTQYISIQNEEDLLLYYDPCVPATAAAAAECRRRIFTLDRLLLLLGGVGQGKPAGMLAAAGLFPVE
mmetsp:Transcript_47124/g.115042  ORF Transcript_47124/g.115042 Transcript_47124/m.115042 type:complete len:93 (-) Transcript_47124:330-608(-)